MSEITSGKNRIEAVSTRGAGHCFVCFGDCCSGIKGTHHAENLAAINAMIARIDPPPDFACFMGDHVRGYASVFSDLTAQWAYWLENEQLTSVGSRIPVYQVTGNHDTYSPESEQLWRELFPEVPRNGPAGQEGLAFHTSHGDLLLVFLHTNAVLTEQGMEAERIWLDTTLREHASSRYKLVLGHHPLLPANGYDQIPEYRMPLERSMPIWDLLVAHGVMAYICSHLIAFDVRCHRGIPQILTGGAGTELGPGGFTGNGEYHHAVQLALDSGGLRYQVLDEEGLIRERLAWPIQEPPVSAWRSLPPECRTDASAPMTPAVAWEESSDKLFAWRLQAPQVISRPHAQTLFCCWNEWEPPVIWAGLHAGGTQVTVHLWDPQTGQFGEWLGPVLASGEELSLELAIHTGMGPGGVLWRRIGEVGWSSMESRVSWGAENLPWPQRWSVGHGNSGISDRRFADTGLQVEFSLRTQSFE